MVTGAFLFFHSIFVTGEFLYINSRSLRLHTHIPTMMAVSLDCKIVPTADEADWLQPNEPIADEALDFDSLFLRILKPTNPSEPQCGDEARSCLPNILPPTSNSQIRTDSTEPIRRAMADTRDLASIPPPTILLGSRRRSPNLSPAKAVPLQ